MKNLKDIILERLHINKDTGNHDHHYNYYPKTRDELQDLVNNLIEERGNKADLNYIDTSEITDMRQLFLNSEYANIYFISSTLLTSQLDISPLNLEL